MTSEIAIHAARIANPKSASSGVTRPRASSTGNDTIQRNGTPYDEREHLTYAFGREAVSFVDRHKDQPFLLYLPFNAVHGPLEPDDEWDWEALEAEH